jgi:zinc transporter, ZIP family
MFAPRSHPMLDAMPTSGCRPGSSATSWASATFPSVSIWAALLWGAFSSASLFVGQALARPLQPHVKATGLLMGFGAGTMLSAVAYELVPLSSLGDGTGVTSAFLVGALVYYVGDRLVDERGGEHRTAIASADRTDGAESDAESGSGTAMFLGALLDGIPEAFILGIGISLGGSVSVAFVAAVFISNVPQGAAGTIAMRASGTSDRTITMMWGALTLAASAVSAIGYLVGDSIPNNGVYAQLFAGGAVLVMLADSMMPEAFKHGGRSVGLLTVLGYLAATMLTIAD